MILKPSQNVFMAIWKMKTKIGFWKVSADVPYFSAPQTVYCNTFQ